MRAVCGMRFFLPVAFPNALLPGSGLPPGEMFRGLVAGLTLPRIPDRWCCALFPFIDMRGSASALAVGPVPQLVGPSFCFALTGKQVGAVVWTLPSPVGVGLCLSSPCHRTGVRLCGSRSPPGFPRFDSVGFHEHATGWPQCGDPGVITVNNRVFPT